MILHKHLVLLTFFVVSRAGQVPLPNAKCSVWDSNCITRYTQKVLLLLSVSGVPGIDTESLDPIYIPYVNIKRDRVINDMENLRLHGTVKSIVDRASLDKFSRQLRLRYTIPCLTLNGNYKASGFYHSYPFNGKGDVDVRMYDVEVDNIYDYDVREDEHGTKFAELKAVHWSSEVTDSMTHSFSNLNGNQTQSDPVLTYLDNNYKETYGQIGRIFTNILNDKLFDSLKYIYHITPLDDLYTDY